MRDYDISVVVVNLNARDGVSKCLPSIIDTLFSDIRLIKDTTKVGFGQHNGLMRNLIEEYNENYFPREVKHFAALLAESDPYDHLITVHHAGGLRSWRLFLSDPKPGDDDLSDQQRTPERAGRPMVPDSGANSAQHRDLH